MTVICAWCQRQISRLAPSATTQARAHAPVSHGMCPSCVRKQLAQVTAFRARAA